MHLITYFFILPMAVAMALSLAFTTASSAADYTYDQLHRLIRTTYPTGYRLDYRYDAAGNLQEIIASQVTVSQISHLVLGTTNHQVLVRSPTGVLEYQFPLSQSGTEIALATLDFDQDHTSEVAVADGPSVTLSELNGTHPLTLPVAELSATVAVGDLNQDGQPELVVASQVVPSSSASLYTLTGNLVGTVLLFPTKTLFSLAVGDVDKDGRADLIAGNLQANEVSVNGHFTFPVFGAKHSSSPNPSANQVTICHRPPGQPSAAQTLTVSNNALPAHLKHGDAVGECPTPIYGVKVAVADLDGDGRAEIIAAMATQGSRLEIYRGDGTFLKGFEAFSGQVGLVVTAGQLIGSPTPEILVSETRGTDIRVFNDKGQLLSSFPGTDTGGIVSLAVAQEQLETWKPLP